MLGLKLSRPIVSLLKACFTFPPIGPFHRVVVQSPKMKRLIAYLFLFLYSYNLAGYLVVFSVRQNLVRSEVKRALKASVPQAELIRFAFHTSSLEQGDYPLQWIEDNEFRYAGGMFDIVRSHTTGDTTYFFCVNDIQEEELFVDLDNHVRHEMGNQCSGGGLDAFKDAFKESYSKGCTIPIVLPTELIHPAPFASMYKSIVLDTASPPPKTFPTA